MEQTYHLSSEIGTELLARSKAAALAKRIYGETGNVIFDFMNVMFISRSFADELCNIVDTFKGRISFANMSQDIEDMISAVTEGRIRGREKGRRPARFLEFDDVESLSEFMAESC